MDSCSGCGVILQVKNPTKIGFVPSISSGRGEKVCRRCFRIRHYGEVQPVEQNEEDYIKSLKEVSKRACVVIHVVDLFDLEGSMLGDESHHIRHKPLVLIGNKIDLFPRSVKRERVKAYLRSFVAKHGLNPVEIVLCSAEKNENMDEAIEVIQRVTKERDVFVIGTANVGKSTFINRLLALSAEDMQDEVTASPYPGTTLDFVRIPLDNEMDLIDTPGFLRKDRLSEWLSPEELKMVTPSRMIRPRGYRLREGQTLFFAGLVRMDVIEGEEQSFVAYVSNRLYVHRTKWSHADEFQATQRGKLLVPPVEGTVLPPWKRHVFHFSGMQKKDLVVSGLGWIACGGAKSTVAIWVPEGVRVEVRKALV